MSQKVVICGAGFIGSYIARAFASANPGVRIVLGSRTPNKLKEQLSKSITSGLSSASMDVTEIATVRPAVQGATTVVSLVGILHGSPNMFDAIQWKGAENVATAAEEVGAKVIHISAIGANSESSLISPRTKGLGEQSVLRASPTATVIRPSLVFGPGDSFFARFAMLSRMLPFLPVFGGGKSKFQPVYVGDLARLVELCSHTERMDVGAMTSGKIIEIGGPDIFTYKEIMQLVRHYSGRYRPIISLPFWVGHLQGYFMEQVPQNIMTITRDQVAQLGLDNVVSESQAKLFPQLLEMQGGGPCKSVHDILPSYL